MKISKTHRQHLPAYIVEQIEEEIREAAELGDAPTYTRIRMSHGVVRLDTSDDFDPDFAEYYYRGQVIEQNSSVPKGYWGRWKVGFGTRGHRDDSLKGCKDYIDGQFYGPVQQKNA
jgi:hypothetical protein